MIKLIYSMTILVLLSSCAEKGKELFKKETGIDLPGNADLVFSKKDKTERAYIWEFSQDISSFELPDSLKYESGFEKWESPWFGGFGELDQNDYRKTMKFRIFRTSYARIAIGKDTENKQIAFSWINTD
jgi:hypothetical protein